MEHATISVAIPLDLAQMIDDAVGVAARDQYIEAQLRATLQRERLLRFLQSDVFPWSDDAHPELVSGAGEWVRSLREENEKRLGEASA